MRKSSNSSLSSVALTQSMGSLTSASSAMTSTLDPCDPIIEEDADGEVQISCTKSEGDLDGSVESSSLKSGDGMQKEKNKGGLFKRFSIALELDKKDGARRPSL